MVLARISLALIALPGVALADLPAKSRSAAPTASPSAASTASNASATTNAPPLTRTPTAPLLSFDLDIPPPPPPSLRLEALRIAGERADTDWRYPEPAPITAYMHGDWFLGYGYFRPRNARSAALHGGSIAATFLGEILLESKTPAAAVGALLTGATLDAAGADVDRDAEARGHAETTKKKRKKHR